MAERIIGKRVYTVDNGEQPYDDYLVVWVGQTAEEATWESASDLLTTRLGHVGLKHVLELVTAFEVDHRLHPRPPRPMRARRGGLRGGH